MTSEQPPREAARPLRPLPSIDVPLLRSERTALRSRQVARWLLLGAMGATGVAALTLSVVYRQPAENAGNETLTATSEPEPSKEESALAAPTGSGPETSFVSDAVRSVPEERRPALPALPSERGPGAGVLMLGSASRSTHNFGKALSFRDALENTGMNRDESTALIAGLTGVVDFRRSHPEDTFVIERDSQGGLTRFEYKASLTQRYEATRDAGGKWKAHQVDVPIRVQRVTRGGVVTGSLGDTLEGLKLGRSLAGVFSEVFEGHVNFSTDTRSGDQFRIIFDEEYVEDTFLRYGTVHAVEYKGDKAGKLRAFWHETKGDGDFYDENGRAMHGGWLRTPLRYDHVSSGFGMRFHPVLKRKQLHNGIDYAASTGTPVRAGAAGTVTFAGNKGANGNLVVLSHAQGYETFYAHLSRFGTGIKSGVKVSQRQVIAYVGSTGRSTGPHLHFSLKRGGKFIDPASQLNGPGLPMAAHDQPEYKRRVRELSSALDKVIPEQPVHVSSAPKAVDPADLGEEEL